MTKHTDAIFKILEEKRKKASRSKRYNLMHEFLGTPGEILTTDVSLETLGTYIVAAILPDDFYFTLENFSNCTGTGVKRLQKSLKELEDCGFLIRKKKRVGSKYVTKYIFIESVTEKTIARVFN